MDQFLKEKADFLSKIDKSKKGSIDKDIIPLIELINSFEGVYTTSSCAGRIVLLEVGKRKDECNWILTKHSKVNPKEIISLVYNSTSKKPIWLKQQPIILHVACKDIEKAKVLLNECKKVFKKSAITSLTLRKVVVEIIGSEHLDTVVSDKNFKADKQYLEQLVKYSNINFSENKKKIKRAYDLLKNGEKQFT